MLYQVAIATLLILFAGPGCKSRAPQAAAVQPSNVPVPAGNTNIANIQNTAPDKPTARPVNAINGRVVGVRENLRFVIVDFAGGRLPQLDQRLFAYRLDQRVAELKVSGPYLGTTVAADVVAGEARDGDLVRDR